MRENEIAGETGRRRSGWRARIVRQADSIVLGTLAAALGGLSAARLHVSLPSGAGAVFGSPGAPYAATLNLKNYGAIWNLVRGGSLGFAESYMNGDADTGDLRALFEFYIANERALTSALPALAVSRGRDRLWHRFRRNTRAGSRRNIAAHYDLGNEFYRPWLDASMSYSSAIYAREDMTLDEAQQEKIRRILEALELDNGHTLLEIGCGWGALAEAAARAGAKVDAITISRRQLDAAEERITAAGLTENVEIRFEDYRDTAGAFDRLVSIEMIEAVGEDNWPRYFSTIAARLAPGGVGVVQAITIRESAFEAYRCNPDFIQRYIFPGGMLPTVELMRQRSEEAGLEFEVVHRFGASYARTLAQWRQRFEAAWPRIAALGFDERFRRMWLYYLIYCEVGFERGMIDVGLYRLRKPR
jgi:cyclopropane-fatty-acyl-phospholipid synthase